MRTNYRDKGFVRDSVMSGSIFHSKDYTVIPHLFHTFVSEWLHERVDQKKKNKKRKEEDWIYIHNITICLDTSYGTYQSLASSDLDTMHLNAMRLEPVSDLSNPIPCPEPTDSISFHFKLTSQSVPLNNSFDTCRAIALTVHHVTPTLS